MKFLAAAVAVVMALGVQADDPNTQTCISPGASGCNLKGKVCCNSNEFYCHMQPDWEVGFCKKSGEQPKTTTA